MCCLHCTPAFISSSFPVSFGTVLTNSSISYVFVRSLSQERQRLVQGEQEAAAKEDEGKVDDLGFEHATLDRPRMERGGRRRPKSHRINRGALAEALAVREGEGQW